jgi:hypothetical protein
MYHLPSIVPSSSPLVEDDSNCSTTNVAVDDRHSHSERRRQSCLRVGQVGINEEYVYWKEGKPILFDDSFLHSAVHYHDVNNNDMMTMILLMLLMMRMPVPLIAITAAATTTTIAVAASATL